MPKKTNPIREVDEEAIALAQSLITSARYGALAVNHPETGHPHVTRIAIGTDESGQPITLISDLSLHTKALKANPNASLLLGEPKDNGDPLTHPRITLNCRANFVTRETEDFAGLRDLYLKQNPKAKLYIDFTDFNFVRFDIQSADLNGGFGKAYQLDPDHF